MRGCSTPSALPNVHNGQPARSALGRWIEKISVEMKMTSPRTCVKMMDLVNVLVNVLVMQAVVGIEKEDLEEQEDEDEFIEESQEGEVRLRRIERLHAEAQKGVVLRDEVALVGPYGAENEAEGKRDEQLKAQHMKEMAPGEAQPFLGQSLLDLEPIEWSLLRGGRGGAKQHFVHHDEEGREPPVGDEVVGER